MNEQTKLQSMTHEELVAHAMNLETQVNQTVYSIDKEDIAYALTTMLSVPENFISPELVDTACEKIRGRFTINEETEQLADFLLFQDVDWKKEQADYSGYQDIRGHVHVYFSECPGEREADIVLKEENDTHRFLEHILGADWETTVNASPYFTFNRQATEDFSL